jgi:hypothetical protein
MDTASLCKHWVITMVFKNFLPQTGKRHQKYVVEEYIEVVPDLLSFFSIVALK